MIKDQLKNKLLRIWVGYSVSNRVDGYDLWLSISSISSKKSRCERSKQRL